MHNNIKQKLKITTNALYIPLKLPINRPLKAAAILRGGRQAVQFPNHTRPGQDHLNLGWSRRVGWVGVGPP